MASGDREFSIRVKQDDVRLLWLSISSRENKKALSPFYHKNYFWQKINVRHPLSVLDSFSIKNVFNDKMDFSLFLFSWDDLFLLAYAFLENK